MIIVSVLSVWGSMPLQAHDYLADVDQSAWFVEPSPLMCRLRHSLASRCSPPAIGCCGG
ncbi:MAG: hypothetical protein P8144_05045 [Gammaproteobacteria bacterium]